MSCCIVVANFIKKEKKKMLGSKEILTYEHAQNTPKETLALILDNNMSKSDYQCLRNNAIRKGCNLYPLFDNASKPKELCLPERSL